MQATGNSVIWHRRAAVLLLVSLTAIGCNERKRTSPTNSLGTAPGALSSAAPLRSAATSTQRRRCVAYEAIPDFGSEWEVERYRAFECYAGYDLWVANEKPIAPTSHPEKPDVVVKHCDWSSSGYDPVDRNAGSVRGRHTKIVLPAAFINAQIEKNERLEFGGQLEVERKFDGGVSGVLVATFDGLTLTQLGSLLEALTQAPGQPWPDQEKFHYGDRCAVFSSSNRTRWELLQLLAP